MGPKSKKRKREVTPDRPRRRSRRLAAARGEQIQQEEADSSPPKSVQIDESLLMQLAVPPPSRVTAGEAFETPVVVTFTAKPPTGSSTEIHADTHDIWANLSLMSEDSKVCLAPSKDNRELLRGSLATGIFPLDEPREDIVAFATFSGLTLLEPGRYRFRVNAVKMSNIPYDPPEEGATTLEAIYTKVFEVVSHTGPTEPDSAVRTALDRMGEIGVVVEQERDDSEEPEP